MKKSIWKLKFDGVTLYSFEPLWKQILWVNFYEWDKYPYGATIRILGVEFDFFIGKWVD